MAASTGVRVTTLAGSVTYEHVTVTREGEMLLVNRKDGSAAGVGNPALARGVPL